MPRRLGQHFLHRRSVLDLIASAASEFPDLPILEIGPGKGALTENLVASKAPVIAIEVDPVLVHYLTERFRDRPNFTVLHADVLKVDLAAYGAISVAGNLPYYITSPIVEKVLSIGPLLKRAVFLVQREVAERMAAAPGRRDYGYLSVLVQAYAQATILERVPPEAFKPPPKVDSAVIQLDPHPQPLVPDVPSFLKFAGAAFQMKRKNLRNNLSQAYGLEKIDSLPEARLRAEQLSIAQLADLHNRILKFP